MILRSARRELGPGFRPIWSAAGRTCVADSFNVALLSFAGQRYVALVLVSVHDTSRSRARNLQSAEPKLQLEARTKPSSTNA